MLGHRDANGRLLGTALDVFTAVMTAVSMELPSSLSQPEPIAFHNPIVEALAPIE